MTEEFRGVINAEGVYRIQKVYREQDNTEHWVWMDSITFFNLGAVQHELKRLRALATPIGQWVDINTLKAV